MLGRECDEEEISEEKRLFTEWGPSRRWKGTLLKERHFSEEVSAIQ